jgi:hypothetical protein
MTQEYAKTFSLEESIKLTFSGKELCGTCELVKKIQMQKSLDKIWQEWHGQKNIFINSLHELILIKPKVLSVSLTDHFLHFSTKNIEPQSPPPKFIS